MVKVAQRFLRQRGQIWRDLVIAAQLLLPPLLKKLVLKCFCRATVKRSAHIGWCSAIVGKSVTLGESSRVRPFTLIRCTGDVAIGDYAEVSSLVLVYGASGFSLGSHSYIGPQCLVDTTEPVQIGSSSALGPRCMVFTHGSFLPYTEGYPVKFSGVTVGDHAWLAAGVFLHPGVTVGSDVFINSRAVVTRDIPCGVIAEGMPAKGICTMDRFRRHMTPERIDWALVQVLSRFASVVLQYELGMDVETIDDGVLSFNYRGTDYLIVSIPSSQNGTRSYFPSHQRSTRVIFITNKPDWSPPASLRDFSVFDISTMRASPSRDPIHVTLSRFMRRYYGLQFEQETT